MITKLNRFSILVAIACLCLASPDAGAGEAQIRHQAIRIGKLAKSAASGSSQQLVTGSLSVARPVARQQRSSSFKQLSLGSALQGRAPRR